MAVSSPKLDLRPFVDDVRTAVDAYNLGRPGAYARWRRPPPGPNSDTGLNPYGCADAANLLYTLGDFPRQPAQRDGFIQTLRGFQDPDSGLFHEPTHHEYHCTAHCVAALELFDASPRHPLRALHGLLGPGALETFLDQLDWRGDPWKMSHRGAGAYAALVIARQAPPEWQDRYFQWLWAEADEATGLWRRGCVPAEPTPTSHPFHHLAGTFHYLFNHEHARRPLRYPRPMIDTCLGLWDRRLWPLGGAVSFSEIDWVYCITRALRQSGHRFDDCRQALCEFAREYVGFLTSLDVASDPRCDDLHAVFGCCCALAELQQAVPGLLRTERPLNLVLDRRPFI